MSRRVEDKYGHLRDRVRVLHRQGVPYSQIARQLGMSKTTAWRLADDEHEARYTQSTLQSFERRAREFA